MTDVPYLFPLSPQPAHKHTLIPPQPHSLILAPAPNSLSIRAPIHGIHLVVVARQVLGEFTRAHIPDLEGVVSRAGHQEPTVGGEGALVDVGDVAAEGIYEFTVSGEEQKSVK